MKPPQWVVAFREKVAEDRRAKQSQSGSLPAAAAGQGLLERMKQVEADKAAEAASAGAAASAASDEAPAEPPKSSAVVAPGAAAAVAPATAAERQFHVGDIVLLDDLVGGVFAKQDFLCSTIGVGLASGMTE